MQRHRHRGWCSRFKTLSPVCTILRQQGDCQNMIVLTVWCWCQYQYFTEQSFCGDQFWIIFLQRDDPELCVSQSGIVRRVTKCFITVSVGMVRAIRCHRQNMKTDITDDSKVSRLSVATQISLPERSLTLRPDHSESLFSALFSTLSVFCLAGLDLPRRC